MTKFIFVACALLFSLFGGAAVAQEFNPEDTLTGFYACQARYAHEAADVREEAAGCVQHYSAVSEIAGSPSQIADIEHTNSSWNQHVTYKSDVAHYYIGDFWTVPQDLYGDCEDYALGKKVDLEADGIPSGALRLAIVKIDGKYPHAVLLVFTHEKTYILDSPLDVNDRGHADEKLRTMGAAPDYQFIAVQDQNGVWRDPTDRRLALNN